MDDKIRNSVPNPHENANWFSKIFLFHISPLLTLGKQRPLTEYDMPDPCMKDESKLLTEQLEKY
jgi:hypothetical protein